MTFLGGQISIFATKISDDLFLVIDQICLIFPFFSQIFPIFAMLNVIFDPSFPHKKNTFLYSVYTFTRIRQHYFSKYWGDQCMGRPPTSNFFGDRPPVLPYVSA